ncbi:unnamed protein product [Rhizophagus irregularis]|nr:unnamed protein product [Rhizophagus irregularis]
MEHVFNGPQTDEYRYEKVVEIEKQYDHLSIIRPHETPQQWADRIRGSLQKLLSKREYSSYHVYCLFASFGQLKSKTFYVNGYNISEISVTCPANHISMSTIRKIKIEANTTSDGSSTFSRLDGFEKQLEEREALLRQKENNIKKTIEAQIAEERKHLKDEYDALKSRLESEYNNCMVDMKQKTYSFKHQLESQHNSRLAELGKQYKSHISALDKANAVNKEIGKLSSTISQLKNEKRDIKKTAESCWK